MGYEPLYILPIAYLIGFLVFEYLIRSRWGGYALWLSSLGDKLGFYMWPRPPANVIHLIMPNGDHALLYNQRIQERKYGVLIHTPLGILRSPEKGAAVYTLTSIYIPGLPNPMSLVIYALGGLIAGWISYYYGYLLLGLKPDPVFYTLSLVFMLYIYMYYNAASTSGVEYHEYEVRGLAPPYLHAIPSSNVTSPIKQAKWLNIPILIRVTKSAREAMNSLKRALGVSSESEVAELLAIGEFTEIVMRKAAQLRVEASRVEELFGAFRNLRLSLGRITIGRVAFMFLLFAIGVFVGFALGGGKIAVGPPPQAAQAGVGYGPQYPYPGQTGYPSHATTYPAHTMPPRHGVATPGGPASPPSPHVAGGGG